MYKLKYVVDICFDFYPLPPPPFNYICAAEQQKKLFVYHKQIIGGKNS